MRVVLDTNVLISACLMPGKLEAECVGMTIAGTVTACVTDEVWAEYREVLARDKFKGVRARADQLLGQLEPRALKVQAGGRVYAATDEDDNRLLECAQAAGAAYLITGNLKDFPAVWGVTKIVNARLFLSSR